MKILFLTSAHNSLSQRLFIELTERGHTVAEALATSEEAMVTAAAQQEPDVIIKGSVEKLARSYIEKRVQQARTNNADSITEILSEGSGKSQAKHARDHAQYGFPESTASYLNRDTTLSVSQKGEILAEAYTRSAERSAELVTIFASASLQEIHQREAQELKRIAQGLTRAARRSRNS